jgi:hypothetical protein
MGSVDASDLGFGVGRGPRALVIQGKKERLTFYFQRTVLNSTKDEALYDLYMTVDSRFGLMVFND